MGWLQNNWPLIVSALLAVSEILALIPSVKANSIFQLIFDFLQKAKPADDKK